jgi:hypothetical protein
VEVAPRITAVDLENVEIASATVDYVHGEAPTPLARKTGKEITRVAKESINNPERLIRVRRMRLKDGTIGVVNKAENPPYRLYFSNADFELTNMSSRAEDGPAKVALKGSFMGSGAVDAKAIFFPEGKDANFEAKLAIKDTQLKSLNDLLRAKGKFDVAEGTFSLYSQVRVQNGAVEGYVKPLFSDIKIYDSEQDRNKNPFRKMWEGIAGGIAKILENRHGEVATVTSLKGPVEDPHANAMQILGGLVRNAFIRAILPGFRQEVARLEPLKVRKERKEDEKRKEREEESSSSGRQ